MKEFLTRWLEDNARPSIKASTYTSYEVIVRCHLVPGLGHHQIKALQPAHIQQFYASRLKAGASPRSLSLIHI